MKIERETTTYILVSSHGIENSMFSGYRPTISHYDLVGGHGSTKYFLRRMKQWWSEWWSDHNMERDCIKREVL